METNWLIIGDVSKVNGIRNALEAKGQAATPFIARDSAQALKGVEQHSSCQVIVVCVDTFGEGIVGFLETCKKKAGRPLIIALISQGFLTGHNWRDPIDRLQKEGADRAFFNSPTLLNNSLVPTVETMLAERGISHPSGVTPEIPSGLVVSQPLTPPTRFPKSPPHDERSPAMPQNDTETRGVEDIKRLVDESIRSLRTSTFRHLDELRKAVAFLASLGPSGAELSEEIRIALQNSLAEIRSSTKSIRKAATLRGHPGDNPNGFDLPAFRDIPLGNREKKLLRILLAVPGNVVSKEAIATARDIAPQSVPSEISNLRLKLSKHPSGAAIVDGLKSHEGAGYSLTLPASMAD